jgi:hypothetical protein
MHFTNTIFSLNSNKEVISQNNIIFGNVILESSRIAGDLSPDVKRLLDQANAAKGKDTNEVERIRKLVFDSHQGEYTEFLKQFTNPSSAPVTQDDKKNKKSGIEALVDAAQEAAKEVAKPSRQRFELEKERVKQIALSRGWIPSADLGEWLRIFFEKFNLKEEIVYKLLNIAHNASVKSGTDTQTILSLWYQMYGVFPDTDKIVSIINTTADLQSRYRSYGLFDALRSMAIYPKNNNRYDGDFDNDTDNLIWQELKSLVLRAPLEDTSYLSAQWMRSENALSNALEKAERLKQISEQIDLIGTNQATKALVNQLTTVNRFLQTQGWFKAMQGVIQSLYAGKLAWQVFSAPITGTSPVIDTESRNTMYNLQGQPSSFDAAKQVQSNSNLRLITAQVADPEALKRTEAKLADFKKQVSEAVLGLFPLSTLDSLSQKALKMFLDFIKNFSIQEILSGAARTKIQSSLSSIKNTKKSFTINSNIKVSQVLPDNTAGTVQKAISFVGTAAIIVIMIKLLKKDMSSMMQNPSVLANALLTAANYIISALYSEIIADIYGGDLQRDPLFYNSDGSINVTAFANFDKAVKSLAIAEQDAGAITTLNNIITRKIKIIEDLEGTVNSQIERDVQVGSESKIIRAPADTSAKFTQNISALSKVIAEAISDTTMLISIYDRVLKDPDKQSIDALNGSFIGNGRRIAFSNLEKLKTKRQRYAGVDVVKFEIEKFIRLNILLGPIMARVKKFNNLGMSTASLISGSKSDPNSLLRVMSEIRKNEENKIDKVQKKINEIKARVPNAESYTDSKYIGI